jgi:magnesium transporter
MAERGVRFQLPTRRRRPPELDWAPGYPFALLLMGVISVGLFLIFKARGWL